MYSDKCSRKVIHAVTAGFQLSVFVSDFYKPCVPIYTFGTVPAHHNCGNSNKKLNTQVEYSLLLPMHSFFYIVTLWKTFCFLRAVCCHYMA